MRPRKERKEASQAMEVGVLLEPRILEIELEEQVGLEAIVVEEIELQDIELVGEDKGEENKACQEEVEEETEMS